MKKSLLLLSLWAIMVVTSANTYYVEIFGNDLNGEGSLESPWKTITSSLDKMTDGDTLALGNGVFTEYNIVVAKAITIIGTSAKGTLIQADITKPINGTGNTRVFEIASTVNIQKLTIRNGSFSDGAGIKIRSAAALTISECNILDCYATGVGAGINALGDLTMNKCCVSNNTSGGSGAGIYASRTTANLAEVIITNSTINNNHTTGANKYGGGMCITNGALTLQNSVVSYNSATSKGRGLHMSNATSQIRVFSHNIIAANGTPDVGAGSKLSFTAATLIDYNLVSMGFDGYIDFGPHSRLNTASQEDTLNAFIDSIGLQGLDYTGNGVLAHVIDESSYLAHNKGSSNYATVSDVRGLVRDNTPDIGAYEFISSAPLTSIDILNRERVIILNTPHLIVVQPQPAYTTDEYVISIDPSSSALASVNGDWVTATTEGSLVIVATCITDASVTSSVTLEVIKEGSLGAINIRSDYEYADVLIGKQVQFTTDFSPKETPDTTVTWSVVPEDLASITQDGLFTANAEGTVTVTAVSNGISSLYEQIKLSVIDNTVSFTVDANNTKKEGIVNPCGTVLCWLLDSDIERPRSRSMKTALTEMKAGALRFPYGHLANNYIWTRDPSNVSNGLEPMVAVKGTVPGNWAWAVDSNGDFIKDQDFDEYVSLCKAVGAEPIVCVNIMSYIYDENDDITLDKLIYYAEEWVRYANITKGYGIEHWQIGNEQDHHSSDYPIGDYKVDYKAMATAMRAIDPTIKTAPGLLSNWNDKMLAYCPELIDFTTCHQYLWGNGSNTKAYEVWKDNGIAMISNITKVQKHVTNSTKPNLDIFITETGVTGAQYPDEEVFNLYKGLILFEMQMEEIAIANVRNTFYWGAHSPWGGEDSQAELATLFSNDDANENHMQADVLTAINQNIQSKLISKSASDYVHTYTTLSADDSTMVIFALNKNNATKNIKVTPNNISGFKHIKKIEFAGESEFDEDTKFVVTSEGEFTGTDIEAELAPLSITIIRVSKDKDGGASSISETKSNSTLKVYPNPTHDIITIQSDDEFTVKNMEIYNLMGQKAVNVQMVNDQVNLSQLPAGRYLLKLTDNNDKTIIKAIIKN